MKKTIWGLLGGAVMASSVAMASPVYQDAEGDSTFQVKRGYISASTPLEAVTVLKKNDLYINTKCGTSGTSAVSYTIIRKLADGTVLDTSAAQLCDTTPRTVSYTAPHWFGTVTLSPTTAVSTSAGGMSSTIVHTKK